MDPKLVNKRRESDLKITRQKINDYFDFYISQAITFKFIKPTVSQILLMDLFRACSLPTV